MNSNNSQLYIKVQQLVALFEKTQTLSTELMNLGLFILYKNKKNEIGLFCPVPKGNQPNFYVAPLSDRASQAGFRVGANNIEIDLIKLNDKLKYATR